MKITKFIFFIITVMHLRAQIKLICCPAAVVLAVMTECDDVMKPSLYVSHGQAQFPVRHFKLSGASSTGKMAGETGRICAVCQL